MCDYSKSKIAVRGESKFASFFMGLSDGQLKKRIDGVLNALKEHPDSGDLVERVLEQQCLPPNGCNPPDSLEKQFRALSVISDPDQYRTMGEDFRGRLTCRRTQETGRCWGSMTFGGGRTG